VEWTTPDGNSESGPLTVLWGLIESYKIDIFEVKLSKITNDFLSWIKKTQALSISLTSEFTLMASHLVFLKSKALLPDPGFEEEDYDPPLPKELVDRLLEYKKFQIAAEKLGKLDRINSSLFSRESQKITIDKEDKWLDVSLIDLIAAFNEILNKNELQVEEDLLYQGVYRKYTVSDKIELIRTIFQDQDEILFSELMEEESPGKEELVATFLAILEIVKQRFVKAQQNLLFEEIKLIKLESEWIQFEKSFVA
jgi:segregation and condensation protein A